MNLLVKLAVINFFTLFSCIGLASSRNIGCNLLEGTLQFTQSGDFYNLAIVERSVRNDQLIAQLGAPVDGKRYALNITIPRVRQPGGSDLNCAFSGSKPLFECTVRGGDQISLTNLDTQTVIPLGQASVAEILLFNDTTESVTQMGSANEDGQVTTGASTNLQLTLWNAPGGQVQVIRGDAGICK